MNFKLGLCQIAGSVDKEEAKKNAEKHVRQAAENGAQVIALPEMWDCPYSNDYFRDYAEPADGPTVEFMSKLAGDLGIYLIGGSISELDGDKVYNTSFSFDRHGDLIGRHRKVHLFDIDLPGMRFRESDTFTPGNAVTVFDTPWGKMGAAVCFDVRFPELFRAMANRGAQIIFLPAQFNMKTGPAHWESTLRIRAVDNECFVAAASAARYEGFSYECWGHSLVADPFGSVIAGADETEQILCAELDLERIAEVRRELPTFLHLRGDVYEVAT